MDRTKTIQIKCKHCETWFTSPVFFGSIETFDSSEMSGNKVECPNPKCRKMTSCNKENMRIVSEKGGFRGNDL